jgi:hypothetical protein
MRRQMSFQCRLDFIVFCGTRTATTSASWVWPCRFGKAFAKPLLSKISPIGQQDMREVAKIVDARAEATSVMITRTLVSLTQAARDRATVKMGQRVNIELLGWAMGEVHGNDNLVEYCARLLYSDTGCGIAPESLRWPYSETRASHGRLCRSGRLRSTRRRSDLSPGPGSSASTLTRHRDGL